MKTIEINGHVFEVIKRRTPIEANLRHVFGCDSDIYKCYDRPSQYKVAIWHNWLEWALNTNNVASFYISGHNCMQFTISGCYQDPNTGDIYNLYITRDHNRAYLVG